MWRKQTLPVTENHAVFVKRKWPTFSNVAVSLQALCRQFMFSYAGTRGCEVLLCRCSKRYQQTATQQQELGKVGR